MGPGGGFDEVFGHAVISGTILAAKRPRLSSLLVFISCSDTLHIYAVNRLGHHALDVQSTVLLLGKGRARQPCGDEAKHSHLSIHCHPAR